MFTNEFTYTSSIYHLTLCIDHWSLFSTILRQVNQNQCWHCTLASVVQCLQLLQPEINNKKKFPNHRNISICNLPKSSTLLFYLASKINISKVKFTAMLISDVPGVASCENNV